MITFVGWFLVGVCTALLFIVALAPLFIREHTDGTHCCECAGCEGGDDL